MGWTLEPDENWQWTWTVYNSAYGMVMGRSATLAHASVRMLIEERALLEQPYPATVSALMLEDPERHTLVRATDAIDQYLSAY